MQDRGIDHDGVLAVTRRCQRNIGSITVKVWILWIEPQTAVATNDDHMLVNTADARRQGTPTTVSVRINDMPDESSRALNANQPRNTYCSTPRSKLCGGSFPPRRRKAHVLVGADDPISRARINTVIQANRCVPLSFVGTNGNALQIAARKLWFEGPSRRVVLVMTIDKANERDSRCRCHLVGQVRFR